MSSYVRRLPRPQALVAFSEMWESVPPLNGFFLLFFSAIFVRSGLRKTGQSAHYVRTFVV